MPSNQRRICEVVHTLNVGGAEILAKRFAERFGGPDCVSFACLEERGSLGEQLQREGYVVEVIGRRPGLDFQCARRLGAFFQNQRIDLIHAHQYTPFFYSALARGVGRKPPLLFTEHGRFFPDRPNRKRRLLSPWMLRRGDRVVAVGKDVREALCTNDGLPRKRVEVVYNGIDPAPLQAASRLRQGFRKALGLDDEDFAVLTVARLDPIKDHKTSIMAVAEARKSCPRTRLFLAGEGPTKDELEKLVEELDLHDNVRFLGLRRDVPDLLAAADLFLLNSVSEGIPLTLIEAMHAGTPILATNVGGIPEVVEDGVTGVLAPPGSPGAIAKQLEQLASDPQRLLRLADAARNAASERFTEQAMMHEYETIVAEMLP